MEEIKEKDWLTTFLLCLFLGNFGVHRFYTGKIASGIFQLLTAGGLGIWSLIDLILIADEKFKDSKGNYIKNNKKNLNVALIFCALLVLLNILLVVRDVPMIGNVFNKMDELKGNHEEYYDESSKMQVFIKLDATEEEIAKLGKELKQIEGVESVKFVSKEEILEEYIAKFEGKAKGSLEKYREDNFFPDSYVITVKDIEQSYNIEQKIKELDNVKNVSNGYSSIKTYSNIKTYTSSIIYIYKLIIIIAIVLGVIKTILLIIATIFVAKRRKCINE